MKDEYIESPEMKAFLDLLRANEGRNKIEILNPKRLLEMQTVYCKLKEIILPISPEAKFECGLNHFGTSAGITIEMDEIEVGNKNLKDFLDYMKNASNFEIHPLLNGNISMSVGFDGVVKRIYQD